MLTFIMFIIQVIEHDRYKAFGKFVVVYHHDGGVSGFWVDESC